MSFDFDVCFTMAHYYSLSDGILYKTGTFDYEGSCDWFTEATDTLRAQNALPFDAAQLSDSVAVTLDENGILQLEYVNSVVIQSRMVIDQTRTNT